MIKLEIRFRNQVWSPYCCRGAFVSQQSKLIGFHGSTLSCIRVNAAPFSLGGHYFHLRIPDMYRGRTKLLHSKMKRQQRDSVDAKIAFKRPIVSIVSRIL